MARLPRLAVGGFAHHVIQCVSPPLSLCATPADTQALHATLCQAARDQQVQLHGWCILPTQFHCIATPADAQALPRMMQDMGRRYVRHFNRHHQRRGTLWDGRFRCTVIDPDQLLHVMACVDALAASATSATPATIPPTLPALSTTATAAPPLMDLARTPFVSPASPATPAPAACHGISASGTSSASGGLGSSGRSGVGTSSAPHYLGLHPQPELTPPQQWWSLGNTPYEREAAYRALLDAALHNPQATAAFVDAALHGWVTGSPAFVQRLQHLTSRRISKRSPGRPRRQSQG